MLTGTNLGSLGTRLNRCKIWISTRDSTLIFVFHLLWEKSYLPQEFAVVTQQDILYWLITAKNKTVLFVHQQLRCSQRYATQLKIHSNIMVEPTRYPCLTHWSTAYKWYLFLSFDSLNFTLGLVLFCSSRIIRISNFSGKRISAFSLTMLWP